VLDLVGQSAPGVGSPDRIWGKETPLNTIIAISSGPASTTTMPAHQSLQEPNQPRRGGIVVQMPMANDRGLRRARKASGLKLST
jgi:hypothetical protein